MLNKHASLKSKLLHANHPSYISKHLREAFMERSCTELFLVIKEKSKLKMRKAL